MIRAISIDHGGPVAGLMTTDVEGLHELDTILPRRGEFAAAVAAELARVDRWKDAARRRGRRSRAEFSAERIAARFGVSADGYHPLDLCVGHAVMASMNGTPYAEAVSRTLDRLASYREAVTT